MAERTTLFSPDGRPVSVALPTEVTNLRARGYTDTPPAELRVPAAEPGAETVVFDPAEHTVDQVLEFLHLHPELAESVIAAEKVGKNRSSISGS